MGLIIAVDGPAASGKGTIAKFLARTYGLPHLDTGLLYRAVGLMAADHVIALDDDLGLAVLAADLDVTAMDEGRARSALAGQMASKVAAIPSVRAALLEKQRSFAATIGGAVLDGRDIGTVICPQASVKLFIDADVTVRAQRRFNEAVGRGESLTLQDVLNDLIARDARDRGRADAPLVMAADAHLIDTTNLGISTSCDAARRIVEARRPSDL